MEISKENQQVILKAKDWFQKTIIAQHIINTKKCGRVRQFNINNLLAPYLSAFLTGSVTAEGIARTLVYPRVLGQSITTSLGTNLQHFVSTVLVEAYGSALDGIDIVFTDKKDGRTKYAQLKLGPNTINKDDVKTIDDHFKALRNRARVNKAEIGLNDLIIGVMYGTEGRLSGNYKSLRDKHGYNIYVGKDFWVRLTGEEKFFDILIKSIAEVLAEVNGSALLEETIQNLAKDPEIIRLANLAKI